MSSSDQKLRDFVSQRIEHDHNPQSFKYQLQLEIENHLKKEQQSYKEIKIRMKNEQMQKEEMERRKHLEAKIEEKKNKGGQNRSKHLEERVKSMAELRRRKQEFTAQKLKHSRREELKKSLEKIKQIEKQRQAHLSSKLVKTQSDSHLSRSLQISHLERRNKTNDAEYEALVLKLQSKGIFSQASHKALSELYTQRARHIKSQILEQEDKTNTLIVAKLEKIQVARDRKEAMLREKAQKLKREEQYQKQLKKSKLKELNAKQRERNKKMQTREAMKMLHVQSLKEGSDNQIASSRFESSDYDEAKEYPKIRGSSFRQEIRKQIQNFKRQL